MVSHGRPHSNGGSSLGQDVASCTVRKRVEESAKRRIGTSRIESCEGDGDVVGVVTPLVRGGAQVLHGDQVVELRVQLAMQEVEGKEEDREGQIEVEEEDVELKERRTCTWTQGVRDCALS